ncbi:hypothetical protein ABZ468_37335 [Streptomyces sp. NPDC005708]|uniref:hypothetical protein n=1 Tax=unclassified Streptomyces TaxID=2593676 RepID=UPI00341058DD
MIDRRGCAILVVNFNCRALKLSWQVSRWLAESVVGLPVRQGRQRDEQAVDHERW